MEKKKFFPKNISFNTKMERKILCLFHQTFLAEKYKVSNKHQNALRKCYDQEERSFIKFAQLYYVFQLKKLFCV